MATVSLVVALTLFSIAAGVFVRDVGAGYRSGQSASVGPLGRSIERFYAYELDYEVAVFSTVRVRTSVEALFGSLHIEHESNGSFLTRFRPERPGFHQVTVENLENRSGQVALTVLQQNTIPPDVEVSLLNPLLYGTAVALALSVVLSSAARRVRTPDLESSGTEEDRL